MHAPRSSRSCWRSDKPRQPHGNDTNNSTNKNSKRSNRTAVHRARVAPTGVLVIAFLCLLSMSCQEVSAQCTTTCEAGEKCVGSDCAECDPGTFQDANDHMQTTCKTCMNAYQPNSGQAGCIEFASCGRGKKFVTGTTTTPSTCANCDAGTYQDQSGHFDPDCKPCTGNTFTDQPGQQGCSAWSSCNQGQKWAAGSADADATCSSCTPGTYQNEFSHQHTSCKGCGAGTFQSGHGASGCDDWKTCGKGKKWATGTSTTDATCSPCGSFHYQSKSSHKDTSCTSWSTCGPGYEVTVEPTASNDRLCAMCDYGHYQDGTNQQDCKPCDPGQHQDERGQIECKACGAGKYQKSSGQKDCIAYSTCDRGERWVSGTKTKDSSCRSCDIGKYQNFLNHQRTSCKTCPDGKYQLNTGRGSCPDCTTCEDGFEEVLPCTPTSDRTCEDNDPPTIVLRRPDNNAVITNTYTVEAGLPFDPPIFTATDTAAGTVTKTPPPNLGDIDTSTVRSDQMLTYKATDANMNTATRTITVVVVDTTGPAITFDPAVLQLEAGEEVMRSNFTVGVSIVDRVDGTLGIDLLEYDASDVNVNTLGMYEVVYTLSAPDSNDNEAPPTTRTAAVVDTLPPVITIGFGDRNVSEHNVVIHEAATEFILPSQSAFDTFDTAVNGGDVRRNEEPTFNSVVDDDTQFTFTYTATDASDNTAMVVYVIEVRDTMAPTITISGEHNITHEAGTEYVDAGATATDLLEDAIGRGVEVVVANNVLSKPPSVPAVFTVEYDACDKAGNCDAINRTVHVLDRTAPSIELIGDALLVVEAGSNFSDIDPGVTLADLYYDNADLTLVIDDGGYEAAPTATPVSFNVTYTVTDPSRNTASVTRTITIIDTTPPDLRVNGNLSVTVGDGVTWVEPGIARAYDIVDRDVRSRVVATTQLEEAGVVVPTMCAYSSARAFVPPLSPRVWSSPRMDAVESRAPSGTVYRINYTVADAASNVAFVERVVRVADPTPPSLQLLGDRVQALEYGPDAAFVEADGGAPTPTTAT
ncbi:hypothetical protein PTSG_05572 [Salpingoeca rosetta]|uniref:HYR domain-containing protein n=1 Tax=Salpingoeca rosetta (strain ATCC 50818 / BSB-021) TaxID=946362 RepID=F2UBL1_SALR5|nr:uncharacterized protein PTSG_05572 [Salpingoeca rosetta]EGD73877.1 hypothetical protein PTSG_05572 [Salpingoeca rosetta]|eukprot:XP_004993440.1 hypothetical protein PTSG_05572 [Salpingoeca rosetta]